MENFLSYFRVIYICKINLSLGVLYYETCSVSVLKLIKLLKLLKLFCIVTISVALSCCHIRCRS
jgi:hypothetical protein